MKIIIRCALLTAVAILAVFFLWVVAARPNKYTNHFTRRFVDAAVPPGAAITIPIKVKAFAGGIGDSLFFSMDEPGHILLTDKYLNVRDTVLFALPVALKDSIHNDFFTLFDNPCLYVCGFNIPVVARYNLITRETDIYHKPGTAFTIAWPISGYQYLFRQLDYQSKDQIFSVRDIRHRLPLLEQPVLEQAADGGLATDGTINYQRSKGMFVYTFAYDNKVLLFDTSLVVKQTLHTIDTFSISHLKTGLIAKNTYSNTGPAKRINHLSCLAGRYLFINSLLKSDNETASVFDQNTVIDIYDLVKLRYIGSCYLPGYNGEHLTGMHVVGHSLIGCYRQHIVQRQLDFLLWEDDRISY